MIKNKKGFTLIELLVAILIVGILAAIALPQYQMSVGRAKFATLKFTTKNIFEASNRYYLTNNTAANTVYDLDIDLDVKEDLSNISAVSFTLQDGTSCNINKKESNSNYVYCDRIISGKKMRFYIDRFNPYGNTSRFTNKVCLTYSINTSDITNKICQKETGLTAEQAGCSDDYCSYRYTSSNI